MILCKHWVQQLVGWSLDIYLGNADESSVMMYMDNDHLLYMSIQINLPSMLH